VFNPADWPVEGGDPLALWRAARSEYVRANGWWPGDELDELRERRDVIVRCRPNLDDEEDPQDPGTSIP
jgi:hypothetical protein